MSWVGFKANYNKFERNERFAGETKYPLKKMLKLAMDGIMSFHTNHLNLLLILVPSYPVSAFIPDFRALSKLFFPEAAQSGGLH